MKTSHFEASKAQPAHEGTILAMPVLPEGIQAPFGHAWGHLGPHSAMAGHSHATEEVYFVHRGQGVVVVGDEERSVTAGEVIEIPPHTYHTMRNESDGELLWFALWWEQRG